MLHRLLALGMIALVPAGARADAFDHYINTILTKVPESKSAEKVTKITHAMMVEHGRTLPGVTGAFLVVKTNDNRFARLLVQAGEQKISKTESVPIVIVDRYVTYREGEDRTIAAHGENVRLFGDFRFNLDLGQVVPATVPADVRVVFGKDEIYLEPVGKAEMYLVTKHLPEANPKKTDKLIVGEKFEMRYFNGNYKLYDDGRRSGTLHFKVVENGDVVGHYYSDKDGQKYEVGGKVSNSPPHMVNFLITYPRTTQTFVGFLFTGDARALVGTSRLQGNETGFYALRME